MSILRNNHLNYVANSGNQIYVCSGNERALFVGVYNPTDTVTAVSYNGVSMTLLQKMAANLGTSEYNYLYGLINPSIGTNTIAITGAHTFIGAVSYTGADQTATFPDAHGENHSFGINVLNALTTMADFVGVVGIGTYDAGTKNMVAGQNITMIDDPNLGTGLALFESSNLALTPSNYTFEVVAATAVSGNMGLALASFRAAPPGTSTNSFFI